jgi:hypothetical protein
MEVRSKNQPIRIQYSESRARNQGGRTDRHEEKRYPFVPPVRHSHIHRNVTVRRRICSRIWSHHPPMGKIVICLRNAPFSSSATADAGRRDKARIVVWRGRGKRAHDRRAEPELDERERKPSLRAQSTGVGAVEKVGEYEAGELEEPRDEGRGHEDDDRARRQIVNKHVSVLIECRWGMDRIVPVGGSSIRRCGQVGLLDAIARDIQ